MNDKHTPAPWHATIDEAGRPCVKSDNYWIAECAYHASDMGEPATANARLISAAPELLEAIEDIISDTGTSGYWWGEKARDVVAKAKGEKQ